MSWVQIPVVLLSGNNQGKLFTYCLICYLVECPVAAASAFLFHEYSCGRESSRKAIVLPLLVSRVKSFIIVYTRSSSTLKPLGLQALTWNLRKLQNFSLQRWMRTIANETAYSSALKMLALFGSRVVLVFTARARAFWTHMHNLFTKS